MSTSQKPIAMNVDNKAEAGDDSSLNCFEGTIGPDSGVALGSMSETEQVSVERESELDLSRILAELSPMPQVAEDAQTRRPEQLPSIGKPCESHDENSHAGSEDESPSINEPHGQETYEQQEQQVDEASKSDALHQSNQPVLEPLSPHDAQFAPRQNTLTTTISFPCFPSPGSLSSCAYYNSRTVTDSCARSSGSHPRRSFQPLSSVANTSQAPQEIRHDQEFPMLRREPSNEERITFLRGCSPATLWHFLLDCLSRPAHFNNVCVWTKNAWQFCITHTKRFTEKWDEYNHNKQAVSYVKVSRALKSFENTQFCGLTLLGRDTSRRNTFRFLPSHDSPHIPCVQYEFQASPSTVECVVRQQTPFTKANTLLTPAHSRHNEAIGTNYSPNFEFRARSRVSAKRPMEMCSIEMPLARPIKNYRSDERQLSFLPQPPGMVSSTPVRDRTVPMMGFGRELTNTNPWSYQYMSFSQTAFPSGKNSQNHWANQSPSTYQPIVPLWGYSGSPLLYQVSDSNIQGRTYGAFRNRTPIEFSTPAQPTTYTNENQSNYSFMNNSNDSAFYDDTQSPHSLFEPTHYTSFADGGSAQQEGVQGKNSYSGSGTHHP